MMKAKKLLALVLALILCMAMMIVPAAAENEIADDTVMAIVAGEEITMAQVNAECQEIIDYYNNYHGMDVSGDEQLTYVAISTLVQEKIMALKLVELGLDQLSEDEIATVTADAIAQWDEAISYYMETAFGVTEESSEEDKATALASAMAILEGAGYTQQTLVEEALENAKYQKLNAIMIGEVEVTDEDVMAEFNELVEEDKASCEGNIGMYELYQRYGYEFMYQPEGYRGVIQILLPGEEEAMAAYSALVAQQEEAGEAVDPALQAEIDAAKAAVMAGIQPVYDELAAKFAAGTSFQDLIAEYNTDPGMSDPDTLAKGYAVHRESILYDPAFVEAAFSVNNIGEMSQPYVGTYGAYVVYYLRDIPAGPVEMTDQLFAEMKEAAQSEKEQAQYSATLDAWTAEFDVVYTEAAQPFMTVE